ncbi:MAG: hypothetical protein Kow00107_07380 [Planctomycetota bacterium]
MTSSNSRVSGFTLLEMMVAVGLAIVVIGLVARVFGVCSNVVTEALTSSKYYLDVARLHYWVAEGFHEQDLKKNLAENYCDLWEMRGEGQAVKQVARRGCEAGEGLLFTVASNFVIEDTLQYSNLSCAYVYPELHLLRLEAYFADSPESVVTEGPAATPVFSMRLMFNKWVLYNDAPK